MTNGGWIRGNSHRVVLVDAGREGGVSMIQKVRSTMIALGSGLFGAAAFATGGSGQEVTTFTGSELDGVIPVVSGFLGLGILVVIGIKTYVLGKRGINKA